jgi:low affinity Fe/Cu permease
MATMALTAIAVLILLSVIYLKKFMRDMAAVESELIKELREIKNILAKINEKQL